MSGLVWWVPLVAAVIGGTLVMLSNVMVELFRRRLEAKSLALAFRGEMLAIIEIVRTRQYVEWLTSVISDLKAGRSSPVRPLRVEREYFPIYAANASQIGILRPEVAEHIARAYAYANSFLEDATMPREHPLTPDMHNLVQETLDILTLALKEAESTVKLIEKTYLVEPAWKVRAREVCCLVCDTNRRSWSWLKSSICRK